MLKLLPNFLTVMRLFLALWYPFCEKKWELGIVLVALLTEFMDGFLSRRLGAVTYAGQILDPIADKIFFFSVMLKSIIQDKLEIWQFLMISVRELTVAVGLILLFLLGLKLKENLTFWKKMRPLIWGKITTFMHYLVFMDLLLENKIHKGLLWSTFLIGGVASVDYVYHYQKEMKLNK